MSRSKSGFKREREFRTDYGKRLKLLRGRKPRLVVRPYSKSILGQLVEYAPAGDRVITAVNSLELRKMGWKHSCGNVPASYLAGLLLGKKGVSKGIKTAVLDIGFCSVVKGGRVFAFAKGAIDAGLIVPMDPEMVCGDERLKGGHINAYFHSEKHGSKHQFSVSKPATISEDFEKVKQEILKQK